MDVLIVGAGPTGLFIANEFARYGISFEIIDKAPEATKQSKAIAIQARTIEIFSLLGLSDPFLEQGLKIRAMNQFSGGEQLAHISFENIPSDFTFILSLEQSKTEQLLTESLIKYGHKINREVELISFKETHEGVECELFDHRNLSKRQITPKYLIGADGAHSNVRKGLNIRFEGKVFKDIFSLADVEMVWDFPHEEGAIFLEPTGVLAALPLPEERRYRLIFQLERCRKIMENVSEAEHAKVAKEIPPPTIDEIQSLVNLYTSNRAQVLNPHWMANFSINSRLSSAYQTKRVFLTGDAAHIHSPVGGQGMNTGIQDGFNLAWKIAFTLKYSLSDKLLKTYGLERQEVGKKLLEITEKASSAATTKNSFFVLIRNSLVKYFLKKQSVQKLLGSAISQTNIQYEKNVLLYQKGDFHAPWLGKRIPNVKNKKTSLFSFFNNPQFYYLLLLQGTKSIVSRETLLNLYKKYDASLFIHPIIISTSVEIHSNERVFFDDNSALHLTLKESVPSVYLIRPDGVITYRQNTLDETLIDKYLSNL